MWTIVFQREPAPEPSFPGEETQLGAILPEVQWRYRAPDGTIQSGKMTLPPEVRALVDPDEITAIEDDAERMQVIRQIAEMVEPGFVHRVEGSVS